MKDHSMLFLSLIWLVPLLGALLLRAHASASCMKVRRIALAVGILTLTLAAVVFLVSAGAEVAFQAAPDAQSLPWLVRHYRVGADGLSALLLPATATVAVSVLFASPASELTPRGASQVLLTLSAILGALVSLDVLLLATFWALSLLPLYFEQKNRGDRTASGTYGLMLVGCCAPMGLFVAGLSWPGVLTTGAAAQGHFDLAGLAQPGVFASSRTATGLGCLLLLASLVRIGCFPLHLWIAPLSQRGPGPLTLVTFSTPLGIFVVARVLLPIFPHLCQQTFPFLLPLAVLTALYGAVVALGQHDIRRALGYFWMSQQGFLLSGLSSLTAEGVSGALLHAIGTVIVRSGLVLITLSVAARASSTNVYFLGGFAVRAPHMATAFLLLSVAAIGLPGTVGFVSEDLIVQGLLRAHPIAAVVLLITTALNGILLFRIFQRVFLAAQSPYPGALRANDFAEFVPRERWVSLALIGLLVFGGFASAPLLSVRKSVIRSLEHMGAVDPTRRS